MIIIVVVVVIVVGAVVVFLRTRSRAKPAKPSKQTAINPGFVTRPLALPSGDTRLGGDEDCPYEQVTDAVVAGGDGGPAQYAVFGSATENDGYLSTEPYEEIPVSGT